MKILFLASVAVVAPDPPVSRRLYLDALGLPLEPDPGGEYVHGALDGARHFGVWPLAQAAHACFGTAEWPRERPEPQASIEFEVADADAVAAAERELVAAGFDVLHPTKTEPWGQTVTRVQTAEGAIVGISFAPSLHP